MIMVLNNQNYFINKDSSLESLLIRKDLCILSLKDWYVLLQQKDGIVFPKTLKKILIHKINEYDVSSNVNSFIINGTPFWLDKNTRVGLMHLANCSQDNIELVLGDRVLTIPVDVAKSFLAQLEVYAGKCYLQTQKHLLAAEKLHTIEDIINYDYTAGYPDKITFNA